MSISTRHFPFVLLIVCVWVSGSLPVFAQDSLSVTVTPPLFQLSIGPGESWTSSVKVVNNNAYDVMYAPQVVDFEAQGESGQATFVPLIESFANEPARTDSLGSWIEISKEPIMIKAGRSGDIQFTVRVPENADPGGHYAAIMVGPYQGVDSDQGSHMKVSSFVTSLLFVKIKGDIIESGRIREFVTDKTLYQAPEAKFVLRFENTGNSHLRPQGTISIYNMWGKERGEVLINEKSSFGNVLPRTIRKFEFSWKSDSSFFDIGRYSAIVTLGYGDDGKQNTSATTYFWVIPIVPVLITVSILLTVVLLFMWFVRRYIHRALTLERTQRGLAPHPNVPDRTIDTTPQHVPTFSALVQPIKEGVVDLRSIRSKVEQLPTLATPAYRQPLTAGAFFAKYKLFFAFLGVICVTIAVLWLYFGSVLMPERDFQVEEILGGEPTILK